MGHEFFDVGFSINSNCRLLSSQRGETFVTHYLLYACVTDGNASQSPCPFRIFGVDGVFKHPRSITEHQLDGDL